MSDLDDRIRGALSPLRHAPVPDVPRLRPSTPEPRTTPLGLAAAVAMLILLAGTLWMAAFRAPAAEVRVAARLQELEARVERVEHEELRLLLSRELALLRRELELSREK